ncbi:MAG: hypothetical protein QW231_00075 [Candidatus Bathyarchaeia archaeon]
MDKEEKIRKMAEFRTILEKRIQEMKIELEGLQALLGLLDEALLEKGFRRAEIPKPIPSTPSPLEVPLPPVTEALPFPPATPLRTVTGDLLANLYIQEGSMRVVPAEGLAFDVNTPPFSSFLVERVLAKMQEKDREAAERGEITPEEILSYNITREGDIIREITIRNVTPERSRELKSAILWTLEKMYEKTMRTGA